MLPSVLKACRGAFRPEHRIEISEPDPHGMRHAFAKGDRLLALQGRKRAQQARSIVRERASNERLVGLAAQSKRQDGTALREDSLRDLRDMLRDEAQ